jgi:hypothetical protein
VRLHEFSNHRVGRTINEGVSDDQLNDMQIKLVGVINQIYGRIIDTGTHKPYSLKSLLATLSSQGITLSPYQFREMVGTPPLSNIIANVKGDDVIFKGQTDVDDNSDVEAPDATTDTLDKMSKRAAKKRD